ncbi:Gfo/Idh/MocA family protein [Pseudarthrobacter oxydans]|uniref:Gfo/Idh/MocA family protein n=1 Tax=Pseudarthrobacter oxydans TaxID=1671 RepID=UPI00382BB771
MATEARFGIVGDGWRAQFFHRVAAAIPDRLAVVGVVVRSAEAAARVQQRWGVSTYSTVFELVQAEHPDFVISSAPSEVNAEVMAHCVELGVPVLCETPPARSLDTLRSVWEKVGGSGLIQVAEQYMLMPMNAVRKSLVESGVIGKPTSVQVSSTHLYHAVSMIRGLLGPEFGPVKVSAQGFTAPLVDPLDQKGWTGDDQAKPLETTIATIDFGDAMGLYDFTDNQWHNQLRSRRLIVRGSHGEISNEDVVRYPESKTFLHSQIIRRQTGYDLDLDGYDTDHISFEGRIVWRNPFPGARFSDEEIAISTILLGTAAWTRDEGPSPYPLAEACQDELISLAIESSLTSGQPVTTGIEPWARS